VELVAVIGKEAWNVSEADAWDYVAGLTIGQDISERNLQFAATPPQFSLAKSFPGFGPLGPVLVTPDEFDNPDDLALSCSVNGVHVQAGRTSQMIFSVSKLVAELSATTLLHPGDLVFTGTPAGVGAGRTPPVFLQPGDELVSTIQGIGTMRNRLTASDDAVSISALAGTASRQGDRYLDQQNAVT
jgi:2-keto-4-pentenoate hydratase/2-oxohepta-3-ene-1,7-dioic acid hydratase in catechol pathway